LQSSTNMGIGRTDSEAAFQEFLKRIPSATNMANIAGSSGQLAPPGPLDNGSAYSSMGALPATDVAGSSAGLGGIPRVSSLDFLARLVSQPQFNAPAASTSSPVVPPSNPVKLEPGPGLPGLVGLNPNDLANFSSSAGITAALQAVPALTAAATNPLAAAAAQQLHPAAAAAAALQLQGQLGQLSRLTGPPPTQVTSGTSRSDGEVDKNDQRRARRMLSNRESARRSRRRKQEHLSTLESQIQDLQDDKKDLADRAQSLERRCTSIEEENKRLREENERLRDELHFLRTEITDRKDRNGWRRDNSDDEPTKRNKGDDKPKENGH